MNRFIAAALAAGIVLSGCGDGNPFEDETEDTEDNGDTTTPDPDGIEGDRTLPPGTASPTPEFGIVRTEPTEEDGGNSGDGYVTSVSYNADDDTFFVDNLAFDGGNIYERGEAVSSLGPYAVYEAVDPFDDSFNGNPINQFTHRAIYGVSPSGNTQFAVVRTGAYVGYGFGGFIYQRNNGVNLPTTGQGSYSGSYAGVRDFDGQGGMEYTAANIDIAIDFDDFNDATNTRGDAVRGRIYNRRVYDINGNDVTQTVINGINNQQDASLTYAQGLPTVRFRVGPGVMDNNGEITGEVFSNFVNNQGDTVSFEEGNYYAIVAGDNAEEIVGIVVTETGIGQPDGVTVRETGGFIALR